MARHDTTDCPSCSGKIPEWATVCRHCRAVTNVKKHPDRNIYGVPGDIPTDVARAIRKECGFGCVICGEMICHYDHFDPEYSDLEDEHKAADIALLCTKHHEDRKGNRPVISTRRMRIHRNDPFLIRRQEKPRRSDFFNLPGPSAIKLGGTFFQGATKLIVNRQVAIWLELPVDANDLDETVKFGAEFQDESLNTIASIANNVFTVSPAERIDVDDQSSSITIRQGRKVLLQVSRYETSRFSPSDSEVFQELLHSPEAPVWAQQLINANLESPPIDIFDIQRGDFWFNGCHLEISPTEVLANGVQRFAGNITLSGPVIEINF